MSAHVTLSAQKQQELKNTESPSLGGFQGQRRSADITLSAKVGPTKDDF
jgi:hypothetical protein